MANLKDLRLRIGSVKNTRKITAAMSQIAAARLRKAQNAALAARPYGERLQEVVSHLVGGIDESERAAAHPMLAAREVQHTLYILLTADKGLCGGFNGNVNRALARRLVAEHKEGRKTSLLLVGKKGLSAHKEHDSIVGTHLAPTLETLLPLSKEIAAQAMGAFVSGIQDGDTKHPRVDRVVLFYNRFVSVLTQEVTEVQLVPLVPSETSDDTFVREPVFEPGRAAILDHLIPVAIESALQQAMFNSVAAEIAARRVAMDSATDNASELIADLTLVYNRERQAAITRELMEIIGGSEALKG